METEFRSFVFDDLGEILFFYIFIYLCTVQTYIGTHIKFGKKIENQRNNTQLLYIVTIAAG